MQGVPTWRSALTCAEELPVRLAHRVKELHELPHGLSEMASIIKVKHLSLIHI